MTPTVGMPTATAHGVDLVAIAKGCGIEKSFLAADLDEFKQRLERLNDNQLLFVNAKIECRRLARQLQKALDVDGDRGARAAPRGRPGPPRGSAPA